MKLNRLVIFVLILNAGILAGAVSPGKLAAAEVSNQLCPVSGDKINPDGKFSYAHKGKVYGFCCLKCIKAFKKNPGKYLSSTAKR